MTNYANGIWAEIMYVISTWNNLFALYFLSSLHCLQRKSDNDRAWNHILSGSGATRWKEPGPLNDCMEQSGPANLDFPWMDW